jgi:serine/threonine-protein phosphatase 2B catalytic subunit
MLVAVLNTCSKEELEEPDEEAPFTPSVRREDHAERRKVIKNKILAVGRMARVFALLRYINHFFFLSGHWSDLLVAREESEKVSELKSMSGSNKLPYGTLALGAEGIKEAINNFEEAYVFIPSLHHALAELNVVTQPEIRYRERTAPTGTFRC